MAEHSGGDGPSNRTASPRLTVLVNPASGKGRGVAAGEAAAARLRELGAEVTVHIGASADETRRHTAEAVAAAPDALVIVGGDGTLSAVLDQLLGGSDATAVPSVPVALVPAGTGNDLARALGLPYAGQNAEARAAELALSGAVRRIDVGEAVCPDGHAKFLTVAALGFDAYVSDRTNRLRWPKGKARYYLALLIELARLRPLAFRVGLDDGAAARLPGILAAVGNTRSYGGGLPMCPQADPADGLLELTHIAPVGRLKLLRLFPLLLGARHLARPEVRSWRAERVHIEAPGLVVYADGERVGTDSVSIRLLSGALPILVPVTGRQTAGGGRGSSVSGGGKA